MLMIRRVVGTSMLPTLSPGELVVARRFYRRLDAGNIVIVRHHTIEKIKRVRHVEDGRVYLVGDNAQDSTDSRDFGPLPRSAVIAKLMWPVRFR